MADIYLRTSTLNGGHYLRTSLVPVVVPTTYYLRTSVFGDGHYLRTSVYNILALPAGRTIDIELITATSTTQKFVAT